MAEYFVRSLPDVPFDIGELYSGLIPIDYTNTSNALFFIYQPTTGKPRDELTIFLNGGPGWSSFESFFQGGCVSGDAADLADRLKFAQVSACPDEKFVLCEDNSTHKPLCFTRRLLQRDDRHV